jgi:hypothetical protein
MAWSNNLFYVAFLSQIYLMSYYFPNKVLARMRHVLATYPPTAYPKLYPKPIERHKMTHLAFKYVSRFILLLGFLILYATIFWVDHSTFADDGYISGFWPALYGMIQFLPLIVVELSEFSHLKQMRNAHTASKRIAELQRRGLTDLVSPALLGTAALAFAGAILFDLYVHDFDVGWGHDTVQRALVMAGTNGLLALVSAWHLYGRKQDPHQSPEDRAHKVAVNLKVGLYVSIVLSVFIAVTAADDIYSLDFIDATLVSVYFQAVSLLSLGYVLRSIKPEDIEFDVYKSDTAVT